MYILFVGFFWLIAALTWPVTIVKFFYDIIKLDAPFWGALGYDGLNGLLVFALSLLGLFVVSWLASNLK